MSQCLNASVYVSLSSGDFMFRVGTLAELGHVVSDEYGMPSSGSPPEPTASFAGRFLGMPTTPPVLELQLLATQPLIIPSFQKAFTRLFSRRVKLKRKDVAGFRIILEENPMHLTVSAPLVIVVVDADPYRNPITITCHSGKHTARHILGHRVILMEQGILVMESKDKSQTHTCMFMFEIS
jgi:hypothetical protein